MALRSAVKLAAAALLALGLAACSAAPKADEPVKVLAPAGAPALATLGLPETAAVDYVEGQDVLVSELAKKDGEYDIIIAPINLGVKSWEGSKTYKLDGVVTWGNLYLVGQEGTKPEEGKVAAFGESAVPGLVFKNLNPELAAEAVWYPSVAEASQAILSGQADTALMAQPAAAAAIAKGKENGKNLTVLSDLQKEWQDKEKTAQTGYPQAALFVKESSESKAKGAIAKMADFLKDPTDDQLTAAIEKVTADKLGVPNAQIAVKTWKAQNIHYEKADSVKGDIESFLSKFNIAVPEEMFVK
ncbi:MAG: hypothetical protein HUJ54_03250 [Erysipelotrichaceae bacterium]|nr:hypothetical protein [Erysipelotrichaceae bacterium]